MNSIFFSVHGDPVPWARAGGGRTKAHFTKPKIRQYKHAVGWEARMAMEDRPPFDVAVRLYLAVYVRIPKSFSKKKHAAAMANEIRPISRPDIDNYLKGVMDAMNGVAYLDDALVVSVEVAKHYHDSPHIDVQVTAS